MKIPAPQVKPFETGFKMQTHTQFLTNILRMVTGEDRVVGKGPDDGVTVVFILEPGNISVTRRAVNTGPSGDLRL